MTHIHTRTYDTIHSRAGNSCLPTRQVLWLLLQRARALDLELLARRVHAAAGLQQPLLALQEGVDVRAAAWGGGRRGGQRVGRGNAARSRHDVARRRR